MINNRQRSLVGQLYERESKDIILKKVDNSEINHLYESIKRLHIFRNICSRIFNRHSLANLSYELLVFSIPILAFIGAIASISDYNTYNVFLLLVLFTISISIATMALNIQKKIIFLKITQSSQIKNTKNEVYLSKL